MDNPFTEITERLTAIEKAFEELKNQPEPAKEPEYIRRKEARELVGGISNPTIIAYEKRGLLTPLRIGGTILYNKSEILKAKK